MNHVKEVIPYDTGKVKIGLLYLPANHYKADSDATNIQNALICKRMTMWQKIKYLLGVRYDDYVF